MKGRIYSENWSMNYIEGEGILKCIKAATKLSDKRSIESNADCKKFVFEVWSSDSVVHNLVNIGLNSMLQVLPVAFTKLLTNTPLHDNELQDAIYSISSTYLLLAVSQLRDKLDSHSLYYFIQVREHRLIFSTPRLEVSTLKTLATIMDPRSEFNFRNRSKRPKHLSSQVIGY